MSTTEQETTPAAAAETQPAVADIPIQEHVPVNTETAPTADTGDMSQEQSQTSEEQPIEPASQTQQSNSVTAHAPPQTSDQASPPTETPSTETDESRPAGETQNDTSTEPPSTDSTTPSADPTPIADEAQETPNTDSQPSEPGPTPPPAKPDVPEWVTWEDDLSTPTEEELEEVKETESENDATNIAAREKQVFTDHDDPDQRPSKKIRLSWIIKGVRGTRERPNRARTMNSPAAYIDGLYWTIKFFPRGNKCSSISAYIQCSKEKPQPDKEVPESTFTYFEGPPDADLGQTAEPIQRIKVEATPLEKPEEKVEVEENSKEASASNDTSQSEDEIKPAAEVTVSEEEQDFRCSAQLGMVIYNPEEPRTATCHTSEHQFCPKNCDWGWTNFVGKWDEIHIRKRGERQALLKNDTIGIDAYIRVFDDPTQALWWHGSHDNESNWPSKLLAGYFPMGTPPLYHSPAVAGITAWLLLAPFREVLQNIDTAGWRTDSQVKPRPFISRLQVVLHQMRHMKNDDYVNVHGAIEALRDCGENYNDVKGFWEAFRRGIELELEDEPETLQKLARIFDVEDKKYALPALPVRAAGDVQTALSMIQQPEGLPASGPDFLPLMLEREAFDKISREWKMHHDRVNLNEEITLPFGDGSNYSLYGFFVHVGTRNSGRFYSILRPNGPGTKWLAFEDGDGNKVFSYTRKEVQEYEGLVGDELDNFTSTRQTAYMALYIKTERVKDYLPGTLEKYVAPNWLKKACDLESSENVDSSSREDAPSKPDSVAFEVYHDSCAIGRQGLLDMFNIKQFNGNRGSFRSWALPSKTTIQELRAQLATSMCLDVPERLRVFGMSFGEVGQYGNAMWNQLALDTTLGSLATDVRPLCLWTSTLDTEEDIKLFKMPEPVIPGPPVEEDSSDEDEPAATTPPTLDEILGPDVVLVTDASTRLEIVAPGEATTDAMPADAAEPATDASRESGDGSATPAEPATEPVTEPATDPAADSATHALAEAHPDSVSGTEPAAGAPAPSIAAVEPQVGSARSTPDSTLAETNTNEAPASATEVPTQSSETISGSDAPSDEHEQAVNEAQAETETFYEAPAEPAPVTTTDQPASEVTAPAQPVTAPQASDEALPVEHGHLVDAMIASPQSADDAAVIEGVVAIVAEAQAAAPQEGISPEDEAAIAALIAEDTAALSGAHSESGEHPAANTPPTENNAEDSVPAATEETAATPQSSEGQESEPAPQKPCVYGFIQRFDPENQTFRVSETFFAPRDAPVREYVRKLLKYKEGQVPHVWYRTTAVDGSAVGDSETFNDIHFIDGVDLILGPILSEETITSMRTAGQFWEPFGLSRFLRMQERKHPHAITTAADQTMELTEFGGQYYKGPLVNGRQHGPACELIYANGQTYSGPLRCNLRHGSQGKMVYQNGDTYEGEWAGDEQHGQGTFVQKRTGNKYVGGFMNGKRWGKGTTSWEVADEEADLCQICYGEEIDALFFDCGHVCSCVECAKQCESCPICRRSVRQVVKMYRV